MNKSKYINSKKCRTCGKCCKTFIIYYPKILEKNEKILFSEARRFEYLNTDKIKVIDDGDCIKIEFDIPCKYLTFEKGIYSCAIYNKDNRPELCKYYPYKHTNDCPFKKSRKVLKLK